VTQIMKDMLLENDMQVQVETIHCIEQRNNI